MQSNDIDVALTDMMGLPFAEHFQTYCNNIEGVAIEKIVKVERNPERSKHLETAKATVLGTELDFVNLRSEEYAEDSRIPTQVVSSFTSLSVCAAYSIAQAFGTPLEDALRRDITMNALFYNVHSRAVEDHTGKVGPIARLLVPPIDMARSRASRICKMASSGRLCLHERHLWTILCVSCAALDLQVVLASSLYQSLRPQFKKRKYRYVGIPSVLVPVLTESVPAGAEDKN